MTFKPAKCPNCAGDLQLPEDRDTVKCMYCGSDIVVREAIKLAGGVNIENLLKLAKNAEDSQQYEEAYKYYSTVLEHDSENVAAWIGKAISSIDFIGFVTNNRENVLAKQCIDKAIALASGKEEIKIEIKNRIISNIKKIFTKETDIELSRHAGVLSLIYEVDQNFIPGLIAKGMMAMTDFCRRDKQNDETSIKFYQKAIDLSQNDNRVLQEIILNIIREVHVNPYEVEPLLEKRKAIIDFMHKINPTARPIEEKILNSMHSQYKSSCDQGHGNDKEVYHNLLREVQRFNPTFNSSDAPGLKSGCFIATVAYGSPMASEVEILRTFRDEYLEATEWGKTFIKYYYAIGPHIARLISKSQFLRILTRLILKPIILMVKKYLKGD